jgi:hypothetical protein
MAKLNFDSSDFDAGMNRFEDRIKHQEKIAIGVIGDELLRLSQQEVPHDEGTLQNSGVSESDGDDHIVGYHTPYAARLHEHPEYRFQKNRKGKYLEEPMKRNLSIFLNFFNDKMKEVF